jgi:hypothetical protein
MEEHRYACPTHVREFTRYRGHFNPALERAVSAPAADDDADPESARFAEDPRAPGGADPVAAR